MPALGGGRRGAGAPPSASLQGSRGGADQVPPATLEPSPASASPSGSEDASFTWLRPKDGRRLCGRTLWDCGRGGDDILIKNAGVVLLKDHLRREDHSGLG